MCFFSNMQMASLSEIENFRFTVYVSNQLSWLAHSQVFLQRNTELNVHVKLQANRLNPEKNNGIHSLSLLSLPRFISWENFNEPGKVR